MNDIFISAVKAANQTLDEETEAGNE